MRMSFHCGAIGVRSMVVVGACAFIAPAPAALADPYLPVQTQDSAEFAIADGYITKQMDCTPDMPPVFSGVTWSAPGFLPDGGAGMIHDENPALGGPFVAKWAGNYWDVEYQFC
jgi:hypothetical protein